MHALPLNRYLVEISIPEAAWRKRSTFSGDRNVGWDAEPAGRVSLDWGTDWAANARTLIAEVPSVVVPEEWNILINPLHSDVASLNARKIRKWNYDARLSRPPRRVK